MTRLRSSETFQLGSNPVRVTPPDRSTTTLSNAGPAGVQYAEGPTYTLAGVRGTIAAGESKVFTVPSWVVSDARGAGVTVSIEPDDEPKDA